MINAVSLSHTTDNIQKSCKLEHLVVITICLFVCLRFGNACILTIASAAENDEVEQREISLLSDDVLSKRILAADWNHLENESLLVEALARDRSHWEDVFSICRLKLLSGNLVHGKAPFVKAAKGGVPQGGGLADGNIELLAALRRVQGRTDPLSVEILGAKERTESLFDERRLELRVSNRDVNHELLTIRVGGDYHVGVQGRWRMILCNSSGDVLRPNLFLFPGGGISRIEELPYGSSLNFTISMNDQVCFPGPGKYTLRVAFHSFGEIATRDKINNLIVFISAPITIYIKPIRFTLSDDEEKEVHDHLISLSNEGPVIVYRGPLPRRFPTTPEYQWLVSKSWKAVPALIEYANNKATNDLSRAHALAILYAITGCFDPQVSGVLGDYEYVEYLGDIKHKLHHGNVNVRRQLNFARLWQKWLDGGSVNAVKETS